MRSDALYEEVIEDSHFFPAEQKWKNDVLNECQFSVHFRDIYSSTIVTYTHNTVRGFGGEQGAPVLNARSGQVWGHQRVAASTLLYSFGLRLAITQADARPAECARILNADLTLALTSAISAYFSDTPPE